MLTGLYNTYLDFTAHNKPNLKKILSINIYSTGGAEFEKFKNTFFKAKFVQTESRFIG